MCDINDIEFASGTENGCSKNEPTPTPVSEIDVKYMRMAMDLAAEAEKIDEVPVGALIVRDGVVISTAYNTRETSKCATHHAEILAIDRKSVV